jgi:hypothetical protein
MTDDFWTLIPRMVRFVEGRIVWESVFELACLEGTNVERLQQAIASNVIPWDGVDEIDWVGVRRDYERGEQLEIQESG